MILMVIYLLCAEITMIKKYSRTSWAYAWGDVEVPSWERNVQELSDRRHEKTI
jgi:hypothetical protein